MKKKHKGNNQIKPKSYPTFFFELIKSSGKIIEYVVNTIALLTLIALYFQFSPNLSIVPSSFLAISDPFQVPFIISNNGYFDFKNVETKCLLKEVNYTNNNRLINVGIQTFQGKTDTLKPGEGITARCDLPTLIKFEGSKVISADVAMRITFSIFLYGRQERTFRFIASKSENEQWHWLPMPTEKSFDER